MAVIHPTQRIPIDPVYIDTSGDNQPTYFDDYAGLHARRPAAAIRWTWPTARFKLNTPICRSARPSRAASRLSRYYNGTRRFSNPAGMAGGWIHNYSVTANNVAAPQAGLGGTTPAQAASMLAATAAAIGPIMAVSQPQKLDDHGLDCQMGR